MPKYLHSSVIPFPPYDVSSFGPEGVSIINNMKISHFYSSGGLSPSALTYYWFYLQVRNHGPWDFKFQNGHQYANFGNFHYGAVGTAAGIPSDILLRGAGWAQERAGTSKIEYGKWYGVSPYGDDPDDQYWISAGIEYAKRSGY